MLEASVTDAVPDNCGCMGEAKDLSIQSSETAAREAGEGVHTAMLESAGADVVGDKLSQWGAV